MIKRAACPNLSCLKEKKSDISISRLLLHDTIDLDESGSLEKSTYDILVKCGQGKFVPVSYLRKIPGTIFK
jgi:hypothetical protein